MEHDSYEAKAETAADSRQRALRALMWGIVSDALMAIGLATSTIVVSDVRWTRAYWAALGLLVAKTFVQALVTGVGRRVVPPAEL